MKFKSPAVLTFYKPQLGADSATSRKSSTRNIENI